MPPVLATLIADPAMPFAVGGAMAAVLAVLAWSAVQGFGAQRQVQRRLRIDSDADRRARAGGPRPAPAAGPARPPKPTMTDVIIQRATRFAMLSGPERTKQLRQQMVRAGFFGQNAVAWFFVARLAGAAAGTVGTLFLLGAMAAEMDGGRFWLFVLGGGVAGYLAPNFYLKQRTKKVLMENRLGFPDFMDLMGVCANAGLSMEAALERVSRELADMYPALGLHLQVLCLEVRAGRSIEEALHAMADRMDIAEVRAFATLLQQSKELGSSLSDALRVFSEDMRHKRLSLAEEKAYALPAKLSVPVTACILPVVLFIAILPVIVRFQLGIN